MNMSYPPKTAGQAMSSAFIESIRQKLLPGLNARFATKTPTVATLPTIARDGDTLTYRALASATGATLDARWTFVYDATNAFWYGVGAQDALLALASGSHATSSATYTAGPSLTLPLAGVYRIHCVSHFTQNTSGAGNDMRLQIFAAGSASGPESIVNVGSAAGTAQPVETDVTVTAGQTVDLRYRSLSAVATAFWDLRIEAQPLRVH